MANTSVNMHNLVSAKDAFKIMETMARSRINGNATNATLWRGKPGIGKSSIVRQVAEYLNIGCVEIHLAQLDRVDICGLPSVDGGTTKWNVPQFWPRDPQSKGVIFFDEITSASPDVQVAAYSIILDRAIPNTDYKLPDGWSIIAAGNLATDRAVVKSMSSALANRFMHFELEASSEDWGTWALMNNIHPAVTGYINYRPDNLHKMDNQNLEQGWPSPRSWEGVSKAIADFGTDEYLLQKAVYGLVGPGVGVEFMAFYKIASQFDDVLNMLTNPEAEITIPSEADRRYALCSSVAYLIWNNPDEAEIKNRVKGFYRIVNKLSPDFATALGKMCMTGNKSITKIKAMTYIMSAPEYKEYSKKYSAAFEQAPVKL